MPRILVALGGNALAAPSGDGSWAEATRRMRSVAPALSELVREGWELLLTHGNGPQVGRLLRQGEIAEREVPMLPIDVLGAESEGQIGYLIQQELGAALARDHVPRPVLPIISRIEVARGDPAFRTPSKPVGRYYSDAEARILKKRNGWAMRFDGARGGWRRLLPSPKPVRWLEAPAIASLVRTGWASRCVPVLAGGGGVPVVARGKSRFEGVEAVIDKDRSAALIARALEVETLAIVTDVPAVSLGFRKPWETVLNETSMEALSEALERGEFGEGTMAPKVEAVLDFLRAGGARAVICDIPHLGRAVRDTAGTRVRRG
ncbi:MAG: carbamate kinase [Thermoplasmata archaeon]|nr:carbamate kinase [Thermoplasmata archaeon]